MKISSKKNDIVKNNPGLQAQLVSIDFSDKEIEQEEYLFYENWKRSQKERYYLLAFL